MATFQEVKGKNFFELCKNGTADEILDAIRNGADVNAEDERGVKPLGLAVIFNKNAGAVKALIDSGARMKLEERSYTELIAFTRKNPPSHEVIALLMEYGLLTDVRAYDGTTALMLASSGNDPDIVRALIKSGADVNATRYDGLTSLMAASKRDTPEIVSLLLDAGTVVNSTDTNGMSALHHAAMNTHNPEIVRMLIEAGAWDTLDKNGRTSLILAAMINTPEILGLLIESGSDVHIRDNDGRTALDNARENDRLKGTEILGRLEELSR